MKNGRKTAKTGTSVGGGTSQPSTAKAQKPKAQTMPKEASADLKPVPPTGQLLPLALVTIQTFADGAAVGERDAIEALYKVATMAASCLNSLDLEIKKAYAADLPLWPVNLSCVKSWNAAEITRVPEDLALGSNRKSVVDLEALFKISTPSKLFASFLVSFVEYCRRFRVVLLQMTSNGRQLSALSDKEQLVLTSAYQEVRSQVVEVAKFLKFTWPDWRETDAKTENELIFRYTKQAAALRPLLENDKSRKQWFKLGMNLIEELTGGEFEHQDFGLRELSSRGEDAGAGRFRAGIKESILAGFEAVIRCSHPNAFAKM